MRYGERQRPVHILAPVANRDAYGQNQPTYTPLLSTWGSIQQLRGVLLTLAQAHTSTSVATHLINIRANPAIKENHRVQVGGYPTNPITSAFDTLPDCNKPTFYQITSILDPDGRGREMNLLCTVVKA